MKAEPPKKPAKAKANLLELSDRDSNFETGGGSVEEDCHLLKEWDRKSRDQP